MHLSAYVNTLGQHLKKKYGFRIHKLSINAHFTCPNRDGTRGYGGCTFCNNQSFSPNALSKDSIGQQLQAGRSAIRKRTGANRYLAYFQAYTNTYANISVLQQQYDRVLAEPDVIGLAVGTRPDCVPNPVLDLLSNYQAQGKEIWLELGLQSAFDSTLRRVNRGHNFAEYADAVYRAQQRQLNVCCHLIVGLPGERANDSLQSLHKVLAHGVQGLKIHPLHVVKNTVLAKQWRQNEYTPLTLNEYVDTVSQIVSDTPNDIIFHRLTGTADKKILLAPEWCQHKWPVLNAIAAQLQNSKPTHKEKPATIQHIADACQSDYHYI